MRRKSKDQSMGAKSKHQTDKEQPSAAMADDFGHFFQVRSQ
jgi:hypothetical protein